MTIRELIEELQYYHPDANVHAVDFTNGREYELVVGSDEDDEYDCTISLE